MNRQKTNSLANQRRLREEGEAAILDTLRTLGPLSRLELSRRANLGRTTVFEIVRDLIARAIVVESPGEDAPKGRGRPTTLFSLNPGVALFAGVEVARQHVRVLLINAAHEEIAYGVEPLAVLGDPKAARQIVDLLERVARDCGASLEQIAQVGLGCSGFVNPSVPSEVTQQLQQGLQATLSVPVKVANNSHLASLAEATWGAGRDHDTVLYIHWSSGIGGGWVANRSLSPGAHGMAGEIGHVSIEPEHGPDCYCGGRGCLEMLAGLEALIRQTAGSGHGFTDQQGLLAAAAAGDTRAVSLLQSAARQVGQVIAAAAVLLDPAIVVLGGEVSALGDLVTEPIRTCLAHTVTPRFQRTIGVRTGELKELAAVRGAIALVLPEVKFHTA
jgi:predicted NBD/HSP70 family sugar kinase